MTKYAKDPLLKNMKDEEKLELYGLYKQATVGNNDTAEPGMFYLKDKAKWKAWTKKKGMTQEEAKAAYITFANGRFEFYGLTDGIVK
jgi:diazepam-binding inhibitor (GABA receptor modulating acyl-CoA-binding protein)